MKLCYVLLLEQIDQCFNLSQIYTSIGWIGEENFVLKE
jgi:hypothetical protein